MRPLQLQSSQDVRATPKTLDQEQATAKKKDDIETLILKLHQIHITDPQYALPFYCVIKLDPTIDKIFSSAKSHNGTISSHIPFNTASSPQSPQSPSHPPITYYGCGDVGHTMHDCEALNELVSRGSLAKDAYKRITLPNRAKLPRLEGETLLQNIIDLLHRIEPIQFASLPMKKKRTQTKITKKS